MTESDLLLELISINKGILKELRDRRDEGKAIYNSGTLSTTSFTIIDTQVSPGHPVKGFTIRNTGLTNVYFAHNIVRQPQIDADVVDTIKVNPINTTIPSPIFNQLQPDEAESVSYNVNCIKSVHLLAVAGTPTFKIKLIW